MPNQLEWRKADEGLWVASSEGYFAGTVDRQGEHFYLRNTFNEYLGDFDSLMLAQRALASQRMFIPARTVVSPLRSLVDPAGRKSA